MMQILLCTACWFLVRGAIPTEQPSVATRWYISAAVSGTLSRVAGSSRFELTLRNETKHNIAILRFNHLYDVELYDDSGKMLTDKRSYMSTLNASGFREWDWIVLHPDDSVSFRLSVYSARGCMAIPPTARRAKCVLWPSEVGPRWTPEFVRKAHAVVVYPSNIGEIPVS